MIKKEDYEYIGSIGRAHGLQGELSAKLTVDLEPLVEGDEPLFLMMEEQGLLIPMRLESWRTKAGDIDLIKFWGIDNPEAAEAYVGRPLWLSKQYFELEDGSAAVDLLDFVHYVGYGVIDAETNTFIGTIIDVDDTTLNTLLSVERDGEGGELILPIARELIECIDPDQKLLHLHIPSGLLE